jgi:hypothetical protein
MGVGTAGAMVDISTHVDLEAGIDRSWGREDEFRDTRPGTFSFVVDNSTGDYTPGNTASSLATTVTEGMAVCWQLGTRLTAGTVRGIEPTFPQDESAWAQVRITCDDMLGNLSRNQVDNLSRSMVLGASPYLYWPFNDAAGSTDASEQSGNQQPSFDGSIAGSLLPTYGATAISFLGETQATFAGVGFISTSTANFTMKKYPPGAGGGCWGAWFTPGTASATGSFTITLLDGSTVQFGINAGAYFATVDASFTVTSTVVAQAGVPQYLQMKVTARPFTNDLKIELFVNGVSQGSINTGFSIGTFIPGPSTVSFSTTGGLTISHLANTPQPVPEYLLGPTATEADLLNAVDATTAEVTLGTLPSSLSTALVSPAGDTGSALDVLNTIIKTEQGYLYTATTGTLTAATQTVIVRERTRGNTVDYTFDTKLDLQGSVPFVRDSTNIVSLLTTEGPTRSVVLQDSTVVSRVGSASTSESVLNTGYVDLLEWGEDRLNRGKNANLRVQSVTIDGMNTGTDRTSDLLALIPGCRIQISSNPTTQLGFSTWDGWLLGGTEHHSISEHTFELYLAPALPKTGIYDTNLYMADSALTLSASINSSVTSMSVATTGPKLETSAVPYDLLIDSEQVTVTACTGATPQVATITRAVNGTAAAAHTTSSTIEVATDSLYAF